MSEVAIDVSSEVAPDPAIVEDENTLSSIPSVEETVPTPEVDTSQSASTDTPAKPKIVRPVQETLHVPVTPLDIIEYEWPVKSSERYFLQEQIAELLDVKSFKRKYAEMTRRTVEVAEKEYLQKTYPTFSKTIGEHQMHGMTALRGIEVHELMSAEYPQIYTEYQKAAVQKIKMELANKQKELEAIKNDKAKMEELRKKAIQSACEFNGDLALIKKQERKYFWDLQTSIIQCPSNRWLRLPPSRTRSQPYPCALIHGQYQHYYRRFTRSEMRRLPLNSVVDGHHLFPVHRAPSPPPILVREEDLSLPSLNTPSSPAPVVRESKVKMELQGPPITATPVRKMTSSLDSCPLCGASEGVSPMLTCASCKVRVHTDCIDMPDDIVEVAQSYAWNCIECKKCTICEKPDNEDKMMFCDHCDRGYHTFCVGLNEPPTGLWECEAFCRPKPVEEQQQQQPAKSTVEVKENKATGKKKKVVKKEPVRKEETMEVDESTVGTEGTVEEVDKTRNKKDDTPPNKGEEEKETEMEVSEECPAPSSSTKKTVPPPVTTRRSARRAAVRRDLSPP